MPAVGNATAAVAADNGLVLDRLRAPGTRLHARRLLASETRRLISNPLPPVNTWNPGVAASYSSRGPPLEVAGVGQRQCPARLARPASWRLRERGRHHPSYLDRTVTALPCASPTYDSPHRMPDVNDREPKRRASTCSTSTGAIKRVLPGRRATVRSGPCSKNRMAPPS